MKPLVVIPAYVRERVDVEMTVDAVESVRKTAKDTVDVLVVDDGSPAPPLVLEMRQAMDKLESEVVVKGENTGFARTVNVGLRRCMTEGRDAILMNADVEIQTPNWLQVWQATKDEKERPAAVIGALLMFPNGLIQHAGVYFSLLTRTFDHMFKYGPMDLPEAHKQRVCPVTAAFQYIRHETLVEVGLYDESFLLGWEDVDYCLRTMLAGLSCVYNPNVRAWHHESIFRSRPSPKVAEWTAKSWYRLGEKYRTQSFGGLVPYW